MVRMQDRSDASSGNFNAIKISVASPDQILNWSHGEVTKPETINYRTLRPEKDGLFCERLFGPTKDWECFCGKYKRIRYRGVVCDRCGVEVTRSKVRRERMGHIKLAAPVAHIWFSKTTPSRLGLLLDLSPRNLERVLYFAQHIVTSVDEEARDQKIEELQVRLDFDKENIAKEIQAKLDVLRPATDAPVVADDTEEPEAIQESDEIKELELQLETAVQELDKAHGDEVDELLDIKKQKLLAESKYRELKEKFGEVFQASMGAEAILEILKGVDLEFGKNSLVDEMRSTSGQRRKKAIKRLRVMESFRKSGNRVEDMVLSVLPVLPPELRPMVQLDGGRFATSDLNDLYRRVINRNNRLKRLMDLGAPEIIIRNEKRMLQESVDALIDNGRRGRPIQGSHNHKLKSLSDLLRGKQGRFRQNLLGKRVDYSGRSVIVVGPELKMHECGLPKRMALELFKPFVMHRLVVLGLSPNIKSAKRMVERSRPEVWDILEEVIKNRPVLLNRAPTLHRLGIQAFMPTLIEGNAIQLHPLVCSAFNADFDGDQMAVHVPLSRMAVNEAKVAMLSTHNMLSPASGDPLVSPTLDMVMGCYYLTELNESGIGAGNQFYDLEEAQLAHSSDLLDLRAPIEVKIARGHVGEEWLSTSLGRLIFNEILPEHLEYQNEVLDRGAIKELTAKLYRVLTNDETAEVLDSIKSLGFHYATTSGLTIAINDIQVSPNKQEIIQEANEAVASYEDQYLSGLMSEDERYIHTVSAWERASDRTEVLVRDELENYGGIAVMAKSGTKGNITQIKQMAGMRGLMSNPKGRIIDLPIKSSFREGLTALEYFISTHGARKGLADTALRTADSGYLTRRLIDVSQELIALEEDCGTFDGIWIEKRPDDTGNESLVERVIGRTAATTIANPQTGEIIVERNEEISEPLARELVGCGISQVPVRSTLACEARRGVCQVCYGRLPATGEIVELGQATGIIAAQSIGEPGTQLTMRTFHTGGVAGTDITSGLPRVEELFEARVSKGAALLTDIDGLVEITEDEDIRRLRVVSKEEYREEFKLPAGCQVLVDDGEYVEPGMVLATPKARKTKKESESTEVADNLVSNMAGRVQLSKGSLSIVWEDVEEREHLIARASLLLVNTGDEVTAGQALTQGPLNPHDILNIRGKDELQKYLVNEVQQVYRSQGVAIHDKHIEIILRQMLKRVQVESTGDTELIPGQMVDKFEFQDRNARVLAEGGEPATAKPMLLGVTRASLLTDSFLAAASFQETTRVLTQAAVSGAHDWLLGLKENVIIGRLIPAQVDSLQMEAEALADPVLPVVESMTDDWLEIASQGLGPVGSSQDVNSESGSMISVVDEAMDLSGVESEDDGPVELDVDGDTPNIFSPTEE